MHFSSLQLCVEIRLEPLVNRELVFFCFFFELIAEFDSFFILNWLLQLQEGENCYTIKAISDVEIISGEAFYFEEVEYIG